MNRFICRPCLRMLPRESEVLTIGYLSPFDCQCCGKRQLIQGLTGEVVSDKTLRAVFAQYQIELRYAVCEAISRSGMMPTAVVMGGEA